MADKSRSSGGDDHALSLIERRPDLKLKQRMIVYNEKRLQLDNLTQRINQMLAVEVPRLRLQQDTLMVEVEEIQKELRDLAVKAGALLPGLDSDVIDVEYKKQEG